MRLLPRQVRPDETGCETADVLQREGPFVIRTVSLHDTADYRLRTHALAMGLGCSLKTQILDTYCLLDSKSW